MGYNPQKHSRRSARLKGYDYSFPGWYFVTMCTHNRVCLFGKINDGKMTLNEWGRIAREEWLETESIRDHVVLDAFVIMPNHVHGIIQITHSDRNTGMDNDGPYDVGAYCNTPLQNRNTSHHDDNTPIHNDNHTHKSGFRSPSKTLRAIVRGYISAVTTGLIKTKQFRAEGMAAQLPRSYHP